MFGFAMFGLAMFGFAVDRRGGEPRVPVDYQAQRTKVDIS